MCLFFQLDVLLGSIHNVLHVGDVMLHQVLVQRVIGLQSSNERDRSNIIVTVINHGHLVMEITNIALEGLS